MTNSTGKKILIGFLGLSFIGLLALGVIGWVVYGILDAGIKDVIGGYVINGDKVVYKTGLEGFGSKRSWEIVEADATTFKDLGAGYAKDKNNAYLEGIAVPQSNGATFKLINKPYSADENHVFYNSEILSNSPNNFKIIFQDKKGDFATDGEKVFKYNAVFLPQTIDAATFKRIASTNYLKDKNHVYTFEKMIEGAEPATFEIIPQYDEIYAKDKANVFFDGVKVEDCDAKTHQIIDVTNHRDAKHIFFKTKKISDDADNFKMLTAMYVKDSKNVYWGAEKISDDAANFTAFPSGEFSGYGKDSKNAYWCDEKLEKVDVASFIGLNHQYAKDKNNVWFGVAAGKSNVVEKADAATFELFNGDNIDARDKNNNFNFGFVRSPRN